MTIVAATMSAALILKPTYTSASPQTELKSSSYLYNDVFELPQPWFRPAKAHMNQMILDENFAETNTITFENLAEKTSDEKYQLEYEKQNTKNTTKYVDLDENMTATLDFSAGNGQYKFRVYKIPKNSKVTDIDVKKRKDYLIGKFNKSYVKFTNEEKTSVMNFNYIYDTNGNLFYSNNDMLSNNYVAPPIASVAINKSIYKDISRYTVDISNLLTAPPIRSKDYSKALFAVVFKEGEKNPSLDDSITTCELALKPTDVDGTAVYPPSGFFEFVIPDEDENATYEIHIYEGGIVPENFKCKWKMKPSDFKISQR